MSTSSQNIPKDKFPVIYNDINAILRLLQTKESVARYVKVMQEFADLWKGYNTKQEMKRTDMKAFFQAIIHVMEALNNRIRITQLRLINNEQERVTYMINFLRGVLESITNYDFLVYELYEHVLDLLSSYKPPVLNDGDGKVVVKQDGLQTAAMPNQSDVIDSSGSLTHQLLTRLKNI